MEEGEPQEIRLRERRGFCEGGMGLNKQDGGPTKRLRVWREGSEFRARDMLGVGVDRESKS